MYLNITQLFYVYVSAKMICVYGFFVFVVLLNIFVFSDSLALKLITHTDFCKIQLSHLKNSFCPDCLLRTGLILSYFSTRFFHVAITLFLVEQSGCISFQIVV